MPRFALATWTLLSFFGPVLGDVQELEQKLQRLKAKADADPQTQQTLADLEQQLKGLKEQLKKTKDEMERPQKETAQADDRWAGACFAMAAEVRGGSISEEDMRFLERLAEGNVTLEEAAEVQLIRLATVCLGKRLDEGSEDYAKARELQFQFSRERKRGRVLSLPAEWVEEAEGAAVKEQVKHLSPWALNLMRTQAHGAIHNSKWFNHGPPWFFLVFAAPVPLYYVGEWLLRKLRGASNAAPPLQDGKNVQKEKTGGKKEDSKKDDAKKEPKKDK